PSPNLGKFTSTRAAPSSRAATAAGSSPGSSRMTSPSGEGGFGTTRRPRMSVAIDLFLERLDADAMHHVDEALALAVATLEVDLDQPLDDVGDFRAREGRPEHFAERSGAPGANLALVAADFDLVPLLAVLIDAEDADVADVVVAAGVHASGDVEVELADVVQVIEVLEALLDRLRHRDRAEIVARAADDVGEQADVGRREAERAQLEPQAVEFRLAHVRENQVLLVRHAQLAERIVLREVRDAVHLVRRDVAGRHARALQRDRDCGVAWLLVGTRVALEPGVE